MTTVILLANAYLPISFVDNQYFRWFLDRNGTAWTPVSSTTIVGECLPKCAKLARDYVAMRLKGRTACLIIDEMYKNDMAFYNILLCSTDEVNMGQTNVELYFWDSIELTQGDAETIGILIGETINQLKERDITVNSYASDNCATMNATTPIASAVCLKTLRRIPCACHAFNNIFQAIMKKDYFKDVWEKVWLLYGCYEKVNTVNTLVNTHRYLKRRLLELQADHPMQEPVWKEEWKCSFFGRPFPSGLVVEDNVRQGTEERLEEMLQEYENNNTDSIPVFSEVSSSNGEAKRPRVQKPYKLLSFCETRWHSCLSVMIRFYSLFDALKALQATCRSRKLSADEKAFEKAMRVVEKSDLEKVILYLRPLGQAIDYCQSDSAIHMDVIPVFNALLKFFREHSSMEMDYYTALEDTVCPITVEEIESIVLKKMEMFKCEYPKLEALLKDTRFPLTHESPVEEGVIQQFALSLESETNRFFRDYSQTARIKAVEDLYGEAVEFVHQRDRRRFKPASIFLHQHSTAFPTLYRVYQYLFCQPASSAAVERSFSVQGCFMLGRRNRMKLTTVRDLMMMRMNCLFLKRIGEEDQLVRYIMDHSRIQEQQ